jgi:hypothetical protein
VREPAWSLSSRRGVTSIDQAFHFIEENAQFWNKQKSGKNKGISSVPVGPEIKRGCAGKDKQ